MKKDIHPELVRAVIRCSCGAEFETLSTKKELHVDVCSRCHPFFTGESRLVDAEGSLGQEMQRVYRMMDKDYQIPKKVLEINPDHPVLKKVSQLADDDRRRELIVEQIFESALLIEGLHPDPASMIPRIQMLMESALESD